MKLSSWGRYPIKKSKSISLKEKFDFLFKNENKEYIAYGNGRSYGDSALNDNILYCKSYNYFLDFDEENGVLHCQSGVMLSEIIEFSIPKGWFLKVTPGTKLITLGGAIASDVHGKNHHIEGCFSESVEEFSLLLPSGEIKVCSKEKNMELFLATCGGMGLTGIILSAKIILKKINSQYIKQKTIKTKNLKETFSAFKKYENEPYSVAWIDCLAKKENIGRSLLMLGSFDDDGDLSYKSKTRLNIPFVFPSFILNSFTVKVFNYLYYNKRSKKSELVGIDKFFYPLDAIRNWNKIYGKNGFTQYQFILPKEKSLEGLQEILEKISQSGKGSFLAVLKLYGKSNDNYLSFPIQGYSLAVDFKIEKGLFELLDELDDIVLKYDGRIYLAKDARVSKTNFEKGYCHLEKFRSIRKKYKMNEKFNSLQSKRLGL